MRQAAHTKMETFPCTLTIFTKRLRVKLKLGETMSDGEGANKLIKHAWFHWRKRRGVVNEIGEGEPCYFFFLQICFVSQRRLDPLVIKLAGFIHCDVQTSQTGASD